DMEGGRPASRGFLEDRGGDLFGVAALGERVSDVLRGRGGAREPRDHGGDGRRIGHGSAPSSHPRHSPRLIPPRIRQFTKWSTTLFGACPQHGPGSRARFQALVARLFEARRRFAATVLLVILALSFGAPWIT